MDGSMIGSGGRVPYSGAITDVNLGGYNLTLNGMLASYIFVEAPSAGTLPAIIQTAASPARPAMEIRDSTGNANFRMETTGNKRLTVSGSGRIADAIYSDFVLSVQSTDSVVSWLEILNNGGENSGAFFGMAGDQFQLFNWQGGDTEFWTGENIGDGYATITISKSGNFGLAGGLEYSWSHGWGNGKGVFGIGNARVVPNASVTNAGLLYADAGSIWTMDSDATKTRLGNRVVALTDGATPALNAKLGNVFTLSAAGDRTIAVPTNPINGQRLTIAHTASGADRTLALNAGTGGFRFGSTITGLTATLSGKTDYIETIYNSTANKWDVVSYAKGF